MAIVTTELTSGGTDTPAENNLTASVSPAANALELLEVRSASGGGTPASAPTISGNGLTWVQEETQLYDDGATESHRITVYRAMGASPSTGQITITFPVGEVAALANLSWKLLEKTGVDTSGTNGSGAVLQSVPAEGVGTSASVTLAAFGDAVNNEAHIAVGTFGGTSLTPEGGYTGSSTQTQEGALHRAAWKLGEDLSPSMTIGASTDWGAIALEIKAAGGGVPEIPRLIMAPRIAA